MPGMWMQAQGRGAAGLAMLAALSLSACASSGGNRHLAASPYRSGPLRAYEVNGRRYTPRVYDHFEEKGLASWYSYPAGTRRTASGEWFDPRDMTAAHKTLPLPCLVEVTNLENGRSLKVRVNDRGPFVQGRIIDLSRAAADRLGFSGHGVARVKLKLLGPAPMADAGQIRLAAMNNAPAAAALAPDDAVLF